MDACHGLLPHINHIKFMIRQLLDPLHFLAQPGTQAAPASADKNHPPHANNNALLAQSPLPANEHYSDFFDMLLRYDLQYGTPDTVPPPTLVSEGAVADHQSDPRAAVAATKAQQSAAAPLTAPAAAMAVAVQEGALAGGKVPPPHRAKSGSLESDGGPTEDSLPLPACARPQSPSLHVLDLAAPALPRPVVVPAAAGSMSQTVQPGPAGVRVTA